MAPVTFLQAPDVYKRQGSDRLRQVINKNLTEEQIFNAVKIAVENGLKGLKFYGMIGLPTETQTDIDALIELAGKIKKRCV